MLRLLAFLFAALFTFACGDDDSPPIDSQGDAPGQPVPFRVMTWNVENLHDLMSSDGSPSLSSGELNQKLRELATVIRENNPDFIALQEVENDWVLERLQRELTGYNYRGISDTFDVREVGFLSRYPITAIVSQEGERWETDAGRQRFTRDALSAFVDVQGMEVLAMTVHFRSRLGDTAQDRQEADARRLAEAERVAYLLNLYLARTTRILMLGDVNDEPGSPTYNALANSDVLNDFTLQIPSSERWTYRYQGQRNQIDFIMGSPAMQRDLATARIDGRSPVDSASDHRPVIADFTLLP